MGLSLAFKPEPALAAPIADANPDLDWLRGRTIVHKIVVGLTDPGPSALAILTELGRTAGEIRALTLKPTQGERFEAVLQATGLSSEDARDLVGRIAMYPGVMSAAIEHVLIR